MVCIRLEFHDIKIYISNIKVELNSILYSLWWVLFTALPKQLKDFRYGYCTHVTLLQLGHREPVIKSSGLQKGQVLHKDEFYAVLYYVVHDQEGAFREGFYLGN